ncbi:MAG: aldehyde dehydrogenase family protein [Candidatus Obscuribacterales bacterium]|nr:aldehyde dehydrogenase family protein [Candidatus Obscuribacterales bacterium]
MLKEIVRYPLGVRGITTEEFIEVKSPFSHESIASIGQADEKAINKAIGIAQECFTKTMRSMPAYKRSEILAKTSQLILKNADDLARTISLEGGKPMKDARIEVQRAAGTFAVAGELAMHLDGEQIPMDRSPGNESRLALVLREPLGIIGAITPFNFPLNLVAHKVAPAIAAGNVVVLKPSSQTPISSLKLKALLTEAGLPEEVLQIIPCRGAKGTALVTDPRIAMLTFTGSAQVGWDLRKQIAPGTRIVLELGGNAGVIVHDDADLDSAIKGICRGGYSNAGQSCISVQRVYVQEKVYDKFLKEFSSAVKALKVGDPLDESTDVGPVIDEPSAVKTVEWIKLAEKSGAKIQAGGKIISKNLMEPTVLSDTKPEMNVVCQEIFGPVVTVMKYSTIDEAIAAVNDSRYGLQSAIFTKNIDIAFKAARQIDAGGVIINDPSTFRADHMPYGGRKESGIGLEGVRYAIHELTQPKFICLNL